MRLIDADAMRARVTNDWAKDEEHGHEYGTACFYIDTQPTIDAQEVKHGKWIATGWQRGKLKEYKCTICKKRIWKNNRNKKPNYCERCGTRMDGDER